MDACAGSGTLKPMWRFARAGLTWPVLVVLAIGGALLASGVGTLAYEGTRHHERVEQVRAREGLAPGERLPPLSVCRNTQTRTAGHVLVVASALPGTAGALLWLVTAFVRRPGP
jgi:hypothetical protein